MRIWETASNSSANNEGQLAGDEPGARRLTYKVRGIRRLPLKYSGWRVSFSSKGKKTDATTVYVHN
jgi:hypothetical protein